MVSRGEVQLNLRKAIECSSESGHKLVSMIRHYMLRQFVQEEDVFEEMSGFFSSRGQSRQWNEVCHLEKPINGSLGVIPSRPRNPQKLQVRTLANAKASSGINRILLFIHIKQ